MMAKLFVAISVFLFAPAASAFTLNWEVGAKVSSVGLGLELGRNFGGSHAVRVIYQGVKLGFSTRGPNENGMLGDELEYDGRVRLSNLFAVYDYYPLRGYLRLSAGLMFNDSRATISAQCTELITGCEFGGSRFQPLLLGTVRGEPEFNRFSPYLGFGWRGELFEIDNVSWSMDFGVAWLGETDVELTPDDQCMLIPTCSASIEEEERRIERELEDFQFLPLIGIGLVYQFGRH